MNGHRKSRTDENNNNGQEEEISEVWQVFLIFPPLQKALLERDQIR